eukprot:5242694-Pleurochrysis_carterae.AAC.1
MGRTAEHLKLHGEYGLEEKDETSRIGQNRRRALGTCHRRHHRPSALQDGVVGLQARRGRMGGQCSNKGAESRKASGGGASHSSGRKLGP